VLIDCAHNLGNTFMTQRPCTMDLTGNRARISRISSFRRIAMKGVIAEVLKTFGLLRRVTDSMKKMKSRKERNEMEEYNSRTVLFKEHL
jgi:predicted transcriptional regulator